MSRPGPFLAETCLVAPRRRSHSNPGPDTSDPPHGDEALVQAADRVLGAVGRFIAGDLDYGALRLLFRRYQAEAVRAGLAADPAEPEPRE